MPRAFAASGSSSRTRRFCTVAPSQTAAPALQCSSDPTQTRASRRADHMRRAPHSQRSDACSGFHVSFGFLFHAPIFVGLVYVISLLRQVIVDFPFVLF